MGRSLVRGLSLTQPYASAIVLGVKSIETRSFRTNYRGLVAIHASARMPRSGKDMVDADGIGGLIPIRWEDLPTGAIIGVARLYDCVPTARLVGVIAEHATERQLGDYSPGRWAWLLHEVVRLPTPIPYKGMLGLWSVEENVERRIMRVYREATMKRQFVTNSNVRVHFTIEKVEDFLDANFEEKT